MKSFGLASLFNANLASRGALVGAFWVSVFARPLEKTETLIFADSSSLFMIFEPPGAKTTSKKPFRLVKHKVLFRLNVKSFGLAALFNAKPQPNRDFWRSQSAKPRNSRVERGVGGASAVEFWAPRVTIPGRRGGPVGGI